MVRQANIVRRRTFLRVTPNGGTATLLSNRTRTEIQLRAAAPP
jgi:hypothetical protein